MEKIRICIIGSGHWSSTMGGTEYQIMLLVDRLKKLRNVDLYWLTHKISRDFVSDEYRVVKLRTGDLFDHYVSLPQIAQAFYFLWKIKPEIIYQKADSALISAAAFYSQFSNCKLVWHVASDSNLIKKRNRRQIKRLIDKKFFVYGMKKAQTIIVQTAYQGKLVKNSNKKANIRLIKNFHPSPEKKNNHQKKRQIIWVANFKKLKQPKIFIDLAKVLYENNIDVRCIMIGAPATYPPFYQEELEKKINEVPNLTWLGKQTIEKVNEYIKESMLFINTSKWEGFPNTFIQAWMRETPVVSLTCDPDNIIRNFELGLHSGTYIRLTKDVMSLIHEDKRRIHMGKTAREFALKHHSLKNLNQLIDVLIEK